MSKETQKFKKAPKTTKSKLMKAVQHVKKKRIKIARNVFGVEMDEEKGYFVPDDSKEVCPMGALLVQINGSISYDKFRGRRSLTALEAGETAAYFLGVNETWVECFTNGFDGNSPSDVGGHLKYIDNKYQPSSNERTLEYRAAYRMGQDIAKELKMPVPERGSEAKSEPKE